MRKVSTAGRVLAAAISLLTAFAVGSFASDVVWFDASLPAGAAQLSDGGDSWNWISSNPTPYTGALAHQSSLSSGLHEHFFNYATAPLAIGAGQVLFTYVYIDPANPPSELMLSWNTDSWEHRAYWGANDISYGNDGTNSRRYMGPLPSPGQWVRLEVPASQVGAEGQSATGMGFSLYDGRATWDHSGAGSAAAASAPPTQTASSVGTVTGGSGPWVNGALPAGASGAADGGDAWTWVTSNPTPIAAPADHVSAAASGLHEHFFNYAGATLAVGASDILYTYVYLDPANPPSEIMLAWNADNWEHRAYWGADSITYGNDKTASRFYMGPLPATGQWVLLQVPAASVGLGGQALSGMGFSLYGGAAVWDQSGDAASVTAAPVASSGSSNTTTGTTASTGSTSSTSASAPGTISGGSGVWFNGALPAGASGSADGGDAWTWATSNPTPFAASAVHISAPAGGLHEHFFNYASATLAVGANDILYTYVYLDPANPPSEVMVEWNADNWEHRAYWGADSITYGNDKTASRFYMGPLPATGQWVLLQVPAASVGLGGQTLSGMGFSLYGGTAAWDESGDAASITAGAASASTGTSTPSTGTTASSGSSSSGSSSSGSSGTTTGSSGSVASTGGSSSTGTTGTSGSGTTGSGSSGSGTTPVSGSGSTGVTGVIAGTTGTDGANRTTDSITAGANVDDTALQLPAVGSNLLHVLSPSLLELVSITTKQPDPAQVSSWNFINSSGQASEPAPGKFTVTVEGQTVAVQSVGFKRRVLYAPLNSYDLRIENCLYLQIATPVADGEQVTVTNPDGSLWPAATQYAALVDPRRYSPAIHVNQEGYVPSLAKQAMVGYYLGDMGEMPVNSGAGFNIIDAATGTVVYSGSLSPRQDSGYETTPVPYQKVYMADFSSFTTPGQYQLQVPGMGASLPFLIDDGIAMAWTRTYSLGLYEQRSGMAVSLPYTRFTHAADHTAPASVPVPDTDSKFSFTWNCVAGYAKTVNSSNPAQTAPFLTSNETSLYPYVNTGTIDVSGGHFDAGDYSKYTENSAQLVHELVFAADNIPGLQTFDNLGIPESGDGIPDVLQEAKWEADFLAKMQDADGGFYFLVYPLNREYESNVLPENGDAQVVWPKNTSVTAASVAALAEAGSSPAMKLHYPQQAAVYLQKATLGWQFLMNAIAKHGKAGAYQKLTFYSDNWTHDDELAWAAAAMYAATGNAQYQTQLFQWFPNPADSTTFRWGWWQMAECWGNAIRTYAFAARSGRLPQSALDPTYLATCESQIVGAGDAVVTWGNQSAYGTPFPPATKAVLGGGWYFSLDQAADMAIAYQVNPKPAYINGLVAAMNYEGGTNPVNVTYVEGLGQKRQQQTVSQYAQNSRRVLSPTGNTIGQVTAGFEYLNSYGAELSGLSYPTDSGNNNPYPYYDRWSDAYNVTTEQITVNDARSLISVGFLASLGKASATAWTAPQATISLPTTPVPINTPVTLTVQVAGQSLNNARVVWEARDQNPTYGSACTITPVNNGDQWVEVEVEWPDGRRAFAAGDFQASATNQVWIEDSLPANAVTASGGGDSWNWISGNPSAHTGSVAFQSSIASGEHDMSFTGSTGGMDDDQSTVGKSGSMRVNTGDTLFAWVYLDPANPPTEVMVCWYDGSSWDHRAYWGTDSITWGSDGTPGRVKVGALPAAGGWVQLSVPASAVGLEGATVSGMDFAAFGGRVAWDTIGRSGSQ